MDMDKKIEEFLKGQVFAVVGASRDRSKYGNKVLRAYRQNNRKIYPVNPQAKEVEDMLAYADLSSLPEPIHGISIVTPPDVTERVVDHAAQLGIKHIWMQPGAESEQAIARGQFHDLNVIAGGPCALVVLGYHE